MFGYIVADARALGKEERARYREAYCGLCRRLRLDYGMAGRSELSYDMAFVAMLLGSAYGLDESSGSERCAARPLRRHAYVETEATGYAAAMNVLLAYHKRLDDWKDERSSAALAKSRRLEPFLPAIRERWPAQCDAVARCLAALARMERENELNPDIPANCFGELLGAVFAWRGAAQPLTKVGESLGRFVYLMDACIDLRADLRKERYNPLVAQLGADFSQMLSLMAAECAQELEKLALERDAGIFRNVVYSGLWTRYRMREALDDRLFWRKTRK